MGQQFQLIDAETLARLERKLDLITARLSDATVTPAPEWCSITEADGRIFADCAFFLLPRASICPNFRT